jgi:hypothetical protein
VVRIGRDFPGLLVCERYLHQSLVLESKLAIIGPMSTTSVVSGISLGISLSMRTLARLGGSSSTACPAVFGELSAVR